MKEAQIMICDDNVDTLIILTLALREILPVQVTPLSTGRKVLEYLRACPALPDLLIVDLRLPDVDGDKVTGLLRKKQKFKELPIILMSGMISDISHRAQLAGADLGLRKPFNFMELRGKVKALLRE